MRIYILRHGLAGEADDPAWAGRDNERPLTEKGERKIRKLAKALRRRELIFEQILSSPYVRARQTAEIVAETLGLAEALGVSEHLQPGADHGKLIDELAESSQLQNVLLVGHEPHLSQLMSLLISGDLQGVALTLKKGGLGKLRVEGEIQAGRCASLEWLLPPSPLKGKR